MRWPDDHCRTGRSPILLLDSPPAGAPYETAGRRGGGSVYPEAGILFVSAILERFAGGFAFRFVELAVAVGVEFVLRFHSVVDGLLPSQ